MDHNTTRIYRMMETLKVDVEEIAEDWGMDEEDVQELIDKGMLNEETSELLDRILCIAVNRERALVCEDEEIEMELLEYVKENPSEEIRCRLEWYIEQLTAEDDE